MIVHQFWYNLTPCPSLRALNLYSIRSILKQAHTLYLWAYQPFDNLPSNNPRFQLQDCNQLLPFREFQGYLDNHIHIAHVSDLIRILALKQYGGWWLDSDSLVLRPLPSEDAYYFATLPAKRVGGGFFHYERKPARWAGSKHFTGLDGKDEFNNSPFFVKSANDPWVAEIEAFIRKQFEKKKALPWRTVLNKMQASIVEHQMHDYVHPAIDFCPLPFWMRDNPFKDALNKPQTKFGAVIPCIDEIVERSTVVQLFFMSSEKAKTAERDDAWLEKMLATYPDSALNRLLIRG
ncbi:MAG: hypothetical protein CMF52_00125 [Legionellales bacterium]|nr:hypothetical protein [Legionellales bacterium]|tara:strand:+ start:1737 stop:2609 length:873 start_codon:yes stop_codon:yes gene_type:complete